MKLFCWIALFFLCFSLQARASPTKESIEQDLRRYSEVEGFDHAWDMVETQSYLASDGAKALQDSIYRALDTKKASFCQLLAAVMLYALLLSFAQGRLRKNAVWFGKIALTAVCVPILTEEIGAAKAAINGILGIMEVLIPALCLLNAASGSVFRAALGQSAVLAAAEGGAACMAGLIIPLAVFSLAVSLFHEASAGISLNGVKKLLHSAAVWGMGIILTLVVGTMGVSGFAAGIQDGVGVKTARFVTGSLVPSAGAGLSSAVESVTASAQLVKAKAGLAGLILIASYLLSPVIRLTVTMLLFRLMAAIEELLVGERHTAVFESSATVLSLLVGCMASVSVMAFVAIGIMLGH